MKFLILSIVLFTQIFAETKPDEKIELILQDPKKADGSWGKESDEVEAFQDIKIIDDLSEENTKLRLEEARNFFNSSLANYKQTEKSIKDKKELDLKEKETNTKDKFDWQKKARESNLEKEYKKMSFEGRKFSVVELVKAMNSLDKIENPATITSPVFIDLKASIYREYIKHQVRLKNYNQASEVLNMYLGLGEQFEKEAEPHKLVAMCFEAEERIAGKYKKETLLGESRFMKNCHLLRFADLSYGKDSNQFKRIEKKTLKYISNGKILKENEKPDYINICGFDKKPASDDTAENETKDTKPKDTKLKDTKDVKTPAK
jgi:hypothetical protein